MFETRHAAAETQQEFWIETRRLPLATGCTFYRKLNETLDSIGFASGAREVTVAEILHHEKGWNVLRRLVVVRHEIKEKKRQEVKSSSNIPATCSKRS